MTKCTLPYEGGERDCGRRVPTIAWGGMGGAGCQGQKERKKQSGGFFFAVFLGEEKQFGELLFLSGP